MSDISNGVKEKQTEDFNALSFERKLVELVEELRLRRNLEVESEKTLMSVMDEKYQQELSWDEQIRRHGRDRENLEQQIELLKRKFEDKVCVSDEDKAKQQIMNKTYSHEIRMLKEELRVAKSEKLNLQKKIQELEGKSKLHDNFQESILNQVSEVRKMMKTLHEESKELASKQKNTMENVASTKMLFRKYDLCNQHLQQCIEIIGKKSESLKKELIKSQSDVVLLKQSVPAKTENKSYVLEIEKLQNKVLNLENLLLLSRKENEKTLNNFLESNKLLCKFMDKFSDLQEQEQQLNKKLELLQEKLRESQHELDLLQGKYHESQNELQNAKDEIKDIEEKAILKEKERIENQRSIEMQTENILNQCCSCSKILVKPSDDKITATLTSFIPKTMDKNFMDEFRNGLVDLQQNALMMQSEMSVDNGIHSFSMDQLCVNSADKKITLSQVLKRKLEIMESGDQIELISMKKRFMENTTQSVIVVDNGVEGSITDKMLTYEANDQQCSNSDPDISRNTPSSIKNKMLISLEANDHPVLNSDISVSTPTGIKNKVSFSHEIGDKPLCNISNAAILVSPPECVENNMLISCKANNQPLCNNLYTDISVSLPSNVKNKIISREANDQPLRSNLNPDISMNLRSVDILLDQKYLSREKSFGKMNEDNDKEN